jgi:hypothetical protein
MNAPTSLHPTDQTLSSYGLGKLDDILAEAINTHLEQCPDCRKRVAEMSADSFLQRVRNAQAPDKSTDAESQVFWSRSLEKTGAATPVAANTLPPGLADHPDYEIKRELGRGGMGVVYLAHNILMGRDEVLKVMGRQIMERPGVLDRFLREIRAVAKLRHPNIVTAYHATRVGENIVFAMEYVEGLDLYRMVKAKGALPVCHACNFVYQAAVGLQHAHEEGLVHRDIKPGNLMLSRKGDKSTVKVLDFGLARVTRDEKVDLRLTSEGQALGTPDYIAPEQIVDAPSADVRADIYSLGGTLYHLLTGRPPFQADSLYDMFQAHMSRDADPLNFVRPEVPVELAALVAKMMAKDPGRRFQTPGEVAEALTPFFKKGKVALKGTEPEVSRDGLTAASRPETGAAPTLVERATDAERPVVRAKKTPEAAVPEARWQSLIEVRKTERSVNEARKVEPTRRPPWVRAAVAGAAFLGLAVALGVIVKIRMEDGGTLIVEVSEPGAEITLDKQQVAITWDANRKRAEMKVVPGEHMVEVTKDGFTATGIKVAISEGGHDIVKAFLEPAAREVVKVALKPVSADVPVVRAAVPLAPDDRIAPYPAYVRWGVWRISGSEVVAKRTVSHGSHTGLWLTRDINFEDFAFEADIKRIEGNGNLQISVGTEDYNILYGLDSMNDYTRAYLSYWPRGVQASADPQWIGPVDKNKWDSLRIEKKGNIIVYYVNHKEIFRELNDRIKRGAFALATVNADARFRKIKITGAAGRVMLEGLPNLPTMEE